MDIGTIVILIAEFLLGGGIIAMVTIKDKKTAAILDNMQKVMNDYNSANEGIFTGEKATAAIDAYVDFLKERKAVEEAVDVVYAPVTE